MKSTLTLTLTLTLTNSSRLSIQGRDLGRDNAQRGVVYNAQCIVKIIFGIYTLSDTSIFSINADSFEKLYKELEIVLYHGLKTPRSC